jgi:hypothetical protein
MHLRLLAGDSLGAFAPACLRARATQLLPPPVLQQSIRRLSTSAASTPVTVTHADGIAILTLCNASRLNALSATMLDALGMPPSHEEDEE